ncbi:DUF1572 family protein [Rossellomorea sp. NPDC077527]|uniref:DUF1572 family protein n=1 Tax=Rossellomorea sp. NPDC077527 TaxID=3364510 RepID=UPI0037CB8D2F
MSTIGQEYLTTIQQQFHHFKIRAEQAIAQLSEEDLHWTPGRESNSVAIIMQHLSGNMHSRWIDFLHSDGEKDFRDRDLEFIHQFKTKDVLLQEWNDGWELLFKTINFLGEEDLQKIVTLRGKPLSVMSAIQIEVAHVSYHVGQILYIGKQIKDEDWIVLSIPKNRSKGGCQ